MANYGVFTDQELTDLLKKGDYAAFTELFSRYHALLVNFAYKKSRKLDEAEDAVQEVFVSIWERRYELEIKANLSHYLFRATTNRLLNTMRRHEIMDTYIGSLQNFMRSSFADTDHKARENNLNLIIEKEIDFLPPRTAEVFRMRRNRYMSNREIAQELNLSEQTIETHMKKALKALRARLGMVMLLV